MAADPRRYFTEQFVVGQRRVYGYIVTLLPNRDDAEEAFQETCLVLWDKWNEFDSERDFVAWACGIALNVVRNYRRSQQREGTTLSLDTLAQVADWRLRPEFAADARSRALSECLHKLPTRQRTLVEEAYENSDKIRTLADRLAITPAAVYLRLARIRQQLLECIERALRQGETP